MGLDYVIVLHSQVIQFVQLPATISKAQGSKNAPPRSKHAVLMHSSAASAPPRHTPVPGSPRAISPSATSPVDVPSSPPLPPTSGFESDIRDAQDTPVRPPRTHSHKQREVTTVPAPLRDGVNTRMRAKAKDYVPRVEKLLLNAAYEFEALVMTRDAYPDSELQRKWAYQVWRDANKPAASDSDSDSDTEPGECFELADRMITVVSVLGLLCLFSLFSFLVTDHQPQVQCSGPDCCIGTLVRCRHVRFYQGRFA